MSALSQRAGVFAAIAAVLGRSSFPQAVVLTDDQKEQVHAILVEEFVAGRIELKSANIRTREAIIKYVPGLVNNWVRKDPNLNGNQKYQPKNPGSRTGSGDEQLKNLKALLATLPSGDPNRKAVEDAIQARSAELVPKLTIQVNALPEHLRHLAPAADDTGKAVVAKQPIRRVATA